MADDGQLTPEKQLLKLIEGADKSKSSGSFTQGAGSAPQPPAKPFGASPVEKLRGTFLGRFSFFKRNAKKQMRSGKFSLSLSTVNRVLTLAVAALFIYVVYDAAASAMSLKTPPSFEPLKEKNPDRGAATMVSPLKEGSFYQQKVTSRDIFKEGGKPLEKKKDKKEAAPAEESEVAKSLSLVGISWSSNPDVIIEDKATQKTYFVKRGQLVGDNVKVEAIFKDHVVLSHEGQEFELR